METRAAIRPDAGADGLSLRVQCAGCSGDATLDLRRFTVQGAVGEALGVTYADADIVVWDCSSCGHANADVLTDV